MFSNQSFHPQQTLQMGLSDYHSEVHFQILYKFHHIFWILELNFYSLNSEHKINISEIGSHKDIPYLVWFDGCIIITIKHVIPIVMKVYM